MKDLPTLSAEEFCALLKKLGGRRAWFVYDAKQGSLKASHPELRPLGDWLLSNERDFAQHEAVFLELGEKTGALLGAFVHKTVRGQAQGGLRFWPYSNMENFLSDGLRLAQGMGRKNALAGLFWGGGKGVIARAPEADYKNLSYRRDLYRDYGSFVSSLNGVYVTAEDVGTLPEDMAQVFATTRFVSCVPQAVGGSGNPSPWTAKGVVCAMQAALNFAGKGSLSGKTVAMQGVGNVGREMIAVLLEAEVGSIVATDIAASNVEAVRERFATEKVKVSQVAPDDLSIFEAPCDVFAPNALGGVLNPTTIPKLRAHVVCGAANNQLLDAVRDARLLADRGLVFVPDFVANRMGIVNCANEQYGRLRSDPAIMRHFDSAYEGSVFQVTEQVLTRAKSSSITPTEAANQLADELGQVPHPIWGHRGQQIIDDLVASEWHRHG